MMKSGILSDPEPLPEYLVNAAVKVGTSLNLPDDWLNNGPASQFWRGLPAGFTERLHGVEIGEKLAVYYIDRIDQIFFKTFASSVKREFGVDSK